MHRFPVLIGTIVGGLLGSAVTASAQTVTQVVRYSVTPVARATISTMPAAGNLGMNGTYALSTNAENTKLSISLDRPLPAGYSVTADIIASEGAESTGPISLGSAATDLVRNIPPGTNPPHSFAITVTAPSGAAVLPGGRRVLFTFTSGV